ncbi:formate/nitrite transporter family protein [Cellulomonas wangsupingiae]|uniref:Formate/nitrite transporter family protein n=1 Tax=Cellulomonas wangsupingiae TaxID=2968085 RepID=A0ABY5K1M1_9CELL|nr:formate/nitrite transporter family protein [Cellulomonas wangsupingiae]MCC2335491.1 formate/nitrite transporter family protein [Cellulomonas wangsupingiae]UUI64337.1 formate/nitrite transporter family protein [Cellulomonas wangsupingiae]
MLTIPEAVAAQADSAVHKVALTRTPGLFLVRTMLAGAYIGIGVLIMVTAGGPLVAAGSPWAPLVNGAVFGIALTIVLVAGAELATSAMMILTQGAMLGRITWGRAAVTLLACLAGNLLGAMAFAGLLHVSGLLVPGTAGGDAIARMVAHKAEATTLQLVVRGILCNLLVCLAVWCWGRLTSETARIVAVFACVLVFITSGFEHVVANMTTFSLGLYAGLPEATVAEFARNVAAVGLGNTIGGALLVGAAYAYGSRPAPGADEHRPGAGSAVASVAGDDVATGAATAGAATATSPGPSTGPLLPAQPQAAPVPR